MNDDDFRRAIIDALNRLGAAVEGIGRGVAMTAGAAKKAGKKSKGESLTAAGSITKFADKNQWGFYKATVNGSDYSTKSSEIGEILGAAYESDQNVSLTYHESKNGTYTNRYIETIEITGGGQVHERKPQMPAEEESPF